MEQAVKQQFENYIKLIELKLDEFLPVKYPQEIWESMRYSLLAGGKRLRGHPGEVRRGAPGAPEADPQ